MRERLIRFMAGRNGADNLSRAVSLVVLVLLVVGMFVHGDADGFVPYDMGKRNYEACRAKGKKFLTVHGAEHAVSYYHDNDAYTKQATEFLQDCLARRGFVWPPETDEPEK